MTVPVANVRTTQYKAGHGLVLTEQCSVSGRYISLLCNVNYVHIRVLELRHREARDSKGAVSFFTLSSRTMGGNSSFTFFCYKNLLIILNVFYLVSYRSLFFFQRRVCQQNDCEQTFDGADLSLVLIIRAKKRSYMSYVVSLRFPYAWLHHIRELSFSG